VVFIILIAIIILITLAYNYKVIGN
jgi:hypothetical protein